MLAPGVGPGCHELGSCSNWVSTRSRSRWPIPVRTVSVWLPKAVTFPRTRLRSVYWFLFCKEQILELLLVLWKGRKRSNTIILNRTHEKSYKILRNLLGEKLMYLISAPHLLTLSSIEITSQLKSQGKKHIKEASSYLPCIFSFPLLSAVCWVCNPPKWTPISPANSIGCEKLPG